MSKKQLGENNFDESHFSVPLKCVTVHIRGFSLHIPDQYFPAREMLLISCSLAFPPADCRSCCAIKAKSPALIIANLLKILFLLADAEREKSRGI